MAQQNNPGGQPERGEAQRRPGSEQKAMQTEQEKGQRKGATMTRHRSAMPSRPGGALMGGSPFGMMRRMIEDMDRLFGDFGLGLGADLPIERLGRGLWSPQVEVFEREGNLVVRADLPGMRQEDLRVEVRGDALTIEGERKSEHEEERGGVWRSERSYGSFRRTIPLPEGADVENAEARFENGVLEVTVKMPQQQQARRIEVQSAPGEQGKQGEKPVH
jgi:HSP20 family protein